MTLFIWGRIRFDLVAISALLACALLGIVSPADAFSGLGHPAVVTVAAVLIISQALQNSGVIDVVANRFLSTTSSPLVFMAALASLGAVLSAFMNNVGALALLMPVALQTCLRSGISPALILMPLSFGTILGGLMTMMGTPPNIIIASYRAETLGESFSVFDFAPVGVVTAIVGVLFVCLIGWRLIPRERSGTAATEALFELSDYIFEVKVSDASVSVGKAPLTLETQFEEAVDVIGVVRGRRRIMGDWHLRDLELAAGDVVIVQTDAQTLAKVVEDAGVELVGGVTLGESDLNSDNVEVTEVVITPSSFLVGRTYQGLRVRSRFSLALLGISREGQAFKRRLARVYLKAGDILLLQGERDSLGETLANLGCLPLARRDIRVNARPSALWPVVVFALALAATSLGLLSVHIAFVTAIVVLIALKTITASDAYGAVDWPVIMLLAAMIPIGRALEITGGTDTITQGILAISTDAGPVVILLLVMVVTMTLSDIMNNAATAVVMAPIALNLARQLEVNPDAFLMAVAIGASCAFLTPIGHQNNILVMGPAGYRFGDYWRLGLPLEIIIIAVSVPLICMVWPL
ncbi:MAG: SLC13 family permease [Gammaproteobacteria bacterium]|nr:SLC13 family permease [Gammaproteobacteria bacterium]